MAAPCAGAATAFINDGSGVACEITGTSYASILLSGSTSATSVGSVNATFNGAGNNHAVRIWDTTSLTINGDLTAIRTGASGLNAAAQFGAWPGVGGAGPGPHQSSVLVTGNTTISSDSGNALRLIGGSNTFMGNTQVTLTGGTITILAAGSPTGSKNVFGGNLIINSAGNDAVLYADTDSSYQVGGNLSITSSATSVGARPPAGVWLAQGSLAVDGTTQISTKAATAHGIMATGNSTVNLGTSSTIATSGANAMGASISGTSTFKAAGPLTVSTLGDASHGLQLSGTSSATLLVTGITTQGVGAYGINLANTAAQGVTLNPNGPVTIETQGAGSSGIHSVYNTANAVTVAVGSSILTHGESAHGLELQAPTGDLNAWNVAAGARIETQGKDAYPVYLSSKDGKVGFASAGQLVAGAQGGTGIFIASAPGGADVSNSGQITYASDTGSGISGSGLGGDARIVNSGSIVKLGTGAGGAGIVASHAGASGILTLDNQGSIASQGGTLSIGLQGIAMGSGGVALLNTGTIGSVSAPVTYGLNGSVSATTATLTASNSGRIDADLGGITALSEGGFNITNSGTIAESAAIAIALSGAGALGGTVSNSGHLLARSTGVLSQSNGSLTLSNSGTIRAPEAIRATAGSLSATNMASGLIQGTVQAAGGQIDLNNAGLWSNTGNSVLTKLSNSGTVTFTAPSGGAYHTITTGNYVGNGGLVNLNTWLGDDSSPSDKLIIDGGSATGSTRLGIANTGGGGAQTTGNGILVVDTQNGATTNAGAFTLAGPVSAGAYDYSLVRRANQNWYLSSELIPTSPVAPPAVTPSLPNYRQETSLYAAVPSLAILHSAATMDSFHERMGGAGTVTGDGNQPSRLWTRLIGGGGERKGDALAIYGRSGPAYDHRSTALQLGGDFYEGRNEDGTRTNAGLYFATGQTTGDVRHFNGAAAGSIKLDVTSLGLYWTVQGPQGGYVDFVAQGSHYGVKATSTRMSGVKSSGSGYDVSVEGGLPFNLGGAWALEPQLQVRRQQATLGNGFDIAGQVNYGDVDSLVGRAGLKLSYTTPKLSAWARLDLLNEFLGRSTTNVSSLAGMYGVGFDSNLHGRSVALTAGVDAKLSRNVSVYGSANYRRASGDSRGHGWGAQAGVKVTW